MTYYTRPIKEQEIIKLAYQFECDCIKRDDVTMNPYFKTIKSWADGAEVWEAINFAVTLAYN